MVFGRYIKYQASAFNLGMNDRPIGRKNVNYLEVRSLVSGLYHPIVSQ